MAKQKDVHGIIDESNPFESRLVKTAGDKAKEFLTQRAASIFPLAGVAACALPSTHPYLDLVAIPLLATGGFLAILEPKALIEKPVFKGNSKRKQRGHKGEYFYGNEQGTNREIWISDSESRRHHLLFGTTGAGKTESILGLMANSLGQNSALALTDGKADVSLFSKFFSMLRRFGKEDDLLVVNFILGTLDASIKTEHLLSNQMNPAANDTADALGELFTSFLPTGGASDGIWSERASVFMINLLKPLCYLRDNNYILLDVDVIRTYFTLDKVTELAYDSRVPIKDREGLINLLLTLPGYQEGKKEQEATVLDQFGYIVMQYTSPFGMLADQYAHVMRTQLASIDWDDVVLRKRNVIALLPALEKSPQNLSSLGKIILSQIKSMMASQLGGTLNGTTDIILDARATNGRTFQCIMDEFGYYSGVEGVAAMFAQARSLNFNLLVAGQDYQAFKKSSEEIAGTIVANTASKCCMMLQDPTETADIFIKLAGKAYRAQSAGFERKFGLFGVSFEKSKDVRLEQIDRIDPRDLVNQEAGAFHFLNTDILIRGMSFYANPPQPAELRVNNFIKVYPPSLEEVQSVQVGMNNYAVLMRTKDSENEQDWRAKPTDTSEPLFDAINGLKNSNPTKKAFFGLAATQHKIDVVDEMLVLRIKELESHLNQNLPDERSYSEETVFSNEQPPATGLIATQNEEQRTERQIINEKNQQATKKIFLREDWRSNPLLRLNVDAGDFSERIRLKSEAIVEKWQSTDSLDTSCAYFELETQNTITNLASVEIIEQSNELRDASKESATATYSNINSVTSDIEDRLKQLNLTQEEMNLA